MKGDLDMIKLNLKSKNAGIVLMPITEEEIKLIEKNPCGDEFIYILYKTTDDNDAIQIGMLSSSISKYSPDLANLWRLKDSTTMAYFYNGCSELSTIASGIIDRPVYRIIPKEDRTVDEYTILNATSNNGLDVSLSDVVDGKFKIDLEDDCLQKRMGSI